MLTLLLISGSTAFIFAVINPAFTFLENIISKSMKLPRALSCIIVSFIATYTSSAKHDKPLYAIAGAFFGYFLVSIGENIGAEPSVVHAVGRER
jgi:hypothetical protein